MVLVMALETLSHAIDNDTTDSAWSHVDGYDSFKILVEVILWEQRFRYKTCYRFMTLQTLIRVIGYDLKDFAWSHDLGYAKKDSTWSYVKFLEDRGISKA